MMETISVTITMCNGGNPLFINLCLWPLGQTKEVVVHSFICPLLPFLLHFSSIILFFLS
jgi:hypothetical protein